MRWIGHSGLAVARPGGAPTRRTLDEADRLRVDSIELDVCAACDGTLVLRHDDHTVDGRPVASLTPEDLRAGDPEALTLDEGLEALRGRIPVLLDLKGTAVVGPLGAWLAGRADADALAVCSDDPVALDALRQRAPRVARWRTLPQVGSGPGESRRRIVAALFRHRLPARLAEFAAEVGAAAVTVDQWAVTPALVEEAHRLGLPLSAWTVNGVETVRRMARLGVDLITTDHIAAMRAALAVVNP